MAALFEFQTALRLYMEKHKQNHRKSTKFWLSFRLFCAGKQRIRNEATYLETGFPKIMMRN